MPLEFNKSALINDMRAGKRTAFLDLLRVIACFLVIVNHSASDIFISRTPEDPVWFIGVAYFFFSKPAVPVFFMISGYLLLGKQDSIRKSLSRVARMLLVLVAAALLYDWYYTVQDYPDSTSVELLKYIYRRLIRIHQVIPSNALWYLYAYLGILIALPFLQKMTALMEKRDYWYYFFIAAVIEGCYPIVLHFNGDGNLCEYFSIPVLNAAVWLLLIGQYFARFGVKRSGKGVLAALCLMLLMNMCNVMGTYWEYRTGAAEYLFLDNYRYLPVVLQSTAVFYLGASVPLSCKAEKAVSYVGACTFGIYLFSDLFLSCMGPAGEQLMLYLGPVLGVILYEVIVFACGLGLTAALRKIPLAKRLL